MKSVLHYSWEMGWPSPFGLRVKTGWASLSHIYLGQLLIIPIQPDASYKLKLAKIFKNVKTDHLSNFVVLQIKKKTTHKCLIIVNT